MFDYHGNFKMPARQTTPKGNVRRVGVELEFAAVSARDGAALVHQLFGGEIERQDAHRFAISETRLGDFVCELDSQYVHGGLGGGDKNMDRVLGQVESRVQEFLGDVSSLVVPCEIICPPIALTELSDLSLLTLALREAGASGTRDNLLYAFGAQLNPELPEFSGAYISRVLKAYMLLSPWLRGVIDVDKTRKLTAFADPFPKDYVRKILAPAYAPELDQLIDDYLQFNPTRNRELDLLPLLSHLKPEKVAAAVSDPLIKSRPTFHYRLPDARLDEEAWSIALEWNRWCLVEDLADKPDLLDAMATEYLTSANQSNWALRASEWLLLS